MTSVSDATAADTEARIAVRVARLALDHTRDQGDAAVRLIEQAADVQDRASPRDGRLDVYA